jgi:hypothetical protein
VGGGVTGYTYTRPPTVHLGVNWLVYLYECTLYSVYLYQCTLYSVYLYQCTLYICIGTFVHMVHVSHNVQLYEG